MSVSAKFQKKRVYTQLSKKEIADPFLVIEDLFDFAHLPDIRELLWDWVKTTVTNGYHKNLGSVERYAMITLYEKMEKLIEAVHILNERNLQIKNISRKPVVGKRGCVSAKKPN